MENFKNRIKTELSHLGNEVVEKSFAIVEEILTRDNYTILHLANDLRLDTPDFVNSYSNTIPVNEEFFFKPDIETEVFYDLQDSLPEYVDSILPVYYNDIDAQYETYCSGTWNNIDNAIAEGYATPMESEEDIYKAKTAALYMHYHEQESKELESFLNELVNTYRDYFEAIEYILENQE